jgi:membrane associated rhomboid family serine protease
LFEFNRILIAIIVANGLFSYKGFTDMDFFNKYKFNIGAIRAGEHIRMLTSGFLHANIGHLFFNMFTLSMFAPVVINHFGEVSFVLVYFASLIFGNLLTLVLHKNDLNYTAIGASGAVMGILYSAILIQPQKELGLFYIIPVRGYIFGIGYLLYSIYGMKAKIDNVGHTAHFGGAIGGFAITLAKEPMMFTNNILIIVLLTIPIIILFVMVKLKKL